MVTFVPVVKILTPVTTALVTPVAAVVGAIAGAAAKENALAHAALLAPAAGSLAPAQIPQAAKAALATRHHPALAQALALAVPVLPVTSAQVIAHPHAVAVALTQVTALAPTRGNAPRAVKT